jgi:hypothetical protein
MYFRDIKIVKFLLLKNIFSTLRASFVSAERMSFNYREKNYRLVHDDKNITPHIFNYAVISCCYFILFFFFDNEEQ